MALEYALDASAVLAVIRREPGAVRVDSVIKNSAISTVNLAEVGSFLTKAGYSIAQVDSALQGLSVEIIDFDRVQAMEAARLRPLTMASGLSLGDRACLALAGLRGLTALTGEQVWASLNVGVTVEVFR